MRLLRDAVRAGLQLGAADEARLLLQDLHTQAFEALDGIIGRDRGDDIRDMVHDLAEVDFRLDRRDAERGTAALRLGCPGGGDQCLRWHAAEIEAVTAHQCAFDQHDIEAELRCACSDDKARRAGADDADVWS